MATAQKRNRHRKCGLARFWKAFKNDLREVIRADKTLKCSAVGLYSIRTLYVNQATGFHQKAGFCVSTSDPTEDVKHSNVQVKLLQDQDSAQKQLPNCLP